MEKERLDKILNTKNLSEVFYNKKSVWIQEINNNIAHVGFLDGSPEQDVYIKDLHE